jgi:hypothetical protein
MHTKTGNLYLEIQTSRKSPVGLLRTTFWDKKSKKARHTQHGRITGCTLEQLQMLQHSFRGNIIPADDPEAFKIVASRELGASQMILELARELGLHRMLYSRTAPWTDCIMAMIAGRIVYQGSKLGLCNQWQNTCLWELCGIKGQPDVDKHCYAPLDRLLERQQAIQKKLAKTHLKDGVMVLYDITSTYFEGEYEDSELVTYGYNRDRKKGFEQVVVGLITNEEGCPVGCEVFKGNTNDSSTVMDKMDEIRKLFGLEHFIFVGDRGMVTQGRFEDIRKLGNINTISALTHGQLRELLKRKVFVPDLFDEKNIVEIIDPDDNELRYCLCKNPVTQQNETATRMRLLELTKSALKNIASYKKKTTIEKLGARVGKVLAKYKMGKFVSWSIDADETDLKSKSHKLKWTFDQEKISEEERLDGCYIIRTDTPQGQLDSKSVVHAYKSLGNVERAFRNLKTVQLEMRPVYHKTDDRIRAHVFLCMLAYYVQWHMQQRLQPLFDSDGYGAERRWTFAGIIECMRQRCRHTINIQNIQFQQDGELTDEQQKITDLLNIT